MANEATAAIAGLRNHLAERAALKHRIAKHSRKQMLRRIAMLKPGKTPSKIGRRNVKERRLRGSVLVYKYWKYMRRVAGWKKIQNNSFSGAYGTSSPLYDKSVQQCRLFNKDVPAVLTETCRKASSYKLEDNFDEVLLDSGKIPYSGKSTLSATVIKELKEGGKLPADATFKIRVDGEEFEYGGVKVDHDKLEKDFEGDELNAFIIATGTTTDAAGKSNQSLPLTNTEFTAKAVKMGIDIQTSGQFDQPTHLYPGDFPLFEKKTKQDDNHA